MILKTELLDYQADGFEKLKKLKVGALFMDTGTGKTRTALELIKHRLDRGKVDIVLWLHPYSIKQDLLSNIAEHSNLIDTGKLYTCGIETLSTSVRENMRLLDLVDSNNVYLIVDESSLVKNPYALRSKNIVRIAERCKYKLVLNGTPISKNEADLFNQFFLLDWRILGYKSYWSFEANHVIRDEKTRRIEKIVNTEYLSRRIAPYAYEYKKEVPFLVRYSTVNTYLTSEQEEIYAYVIDELMDNLDEFRPSTIYQFFSALQAVVSGYNVFIYENQGQKFTKSVYLFDNPLDNPRVQTFFDIIDGSDEKYIVFCRYTKEIDVLYDLLNNRCSGSAVKFNGEMNRRRRDASIESFRSGAQFFLANKGCGSFGLNLQFCHNVIYFSHDWDWLTREQSENRVIRIGQNNDVSITDIRCYGTIDVKILDCIKRKERLASSFAAMLREHNRNGMFNFVKGVIDNG